MLCLLTKAQQFAWLSHETDAKAAMEFRCLRAHISQMDFEWVKVQDVAQQEGRYSSKPVDKLLHLIRDYNIKGTSNMEESDRLAEPLYAAAKAGKWTWRTLLHELVTSRCHGHPGWLSTSENDPMWDLLNRLLDINPRTRITAEEALHHKWFQQTDWWEGVVWAGFVALYFTIRTLRKNGVGALWSDSMGFEPLVMKW
jgi:hypothetical protein